MHSQELFAILDLRGLILHSYHSGKDPETANQQIKNPAHTLDKFVERYLLPISKLVPLNRIIAVNDGGNKYRQTIDPEYKATRKAPEPEVKLAMESSKQAIRELLHSLGIVQATVPHTEADDVIAYLCKNLPGHKMVYTVDGDLIALAGDDTTVFLKGEPKSVYIKEEAVVQPRHVSLFKSIVGDTSDNIKGVKGMGPAAWIKMVQEFGEDGMDELIDIMESGDLGKLKTIAKQAQHPLLDKLVANLQDFRKGYLLANLRPELVDGKQGNEFTRIKWDKRLPSRDRLNRLATATGAYWLISDLNHLLPNQYLIKAQDWDDTTLDEARGLFKDSRFISLDWETWAPEHEPFKKASEGTYVDMLSSRITGMGITCGENLEHTFYFSFEHAIGAENIDKKHLLELLHVIPDGMPIVAQNALFERTVLLNELGYDLPNLHDTKIMASHVDESLPAGLKDMSKHWLNYDQIRYNDVIEKGKSMKDYSSDHVFKYGADDAIVTAHLYDLFYIILNLEGTWEFVRDNEFTMTYVLSDAYLAGVSVDYEEVERQRAEDQATYDTNLAKIRGLLRENINETTIYEGAKNWFDELLLNYKAEAAQVIDVASKASKTGDLYQQLKDNTFIVKWIPDVLAEGVELKTIVDAVESRVRRDSLMHDRAKLWAEAVSAATYEDYQETRTTATFQWRVGCLNQLSEKHGLPNWPEISEADKLRAFDIYAEFSQSLQGLSSDQVHYIQMVLDCHKYPKSKLTKCPPYLGLKSLYQELIDGRIEKSGTELNLDSPKQMANLLYGMLGLPIKVRAFEPTDTRKERGLEGAPQTNKDAIATAIAYGDAVGWKREVLECVAEAKDAMTRIKLFYNKFPLWKHPIDGNMHPQFNSTGTETRRPTGSSPNMLQLSKRGEGVKVRRCIVPNKKLGHDLILTCDWDGEELRIIGGLSGDKALTSCYLGDNKRNVHSMTAAGISGVGYEDFVSVLKDKEHPLNSKFSDLRKDAKSVVFLSTYGGGAAKLSRKLLCPIETAAEYLKSKKETYFGQEVWRDREIEKLRSQGYVSTLYGSRKHVFNKLSTSDEGLRGYYERSSVNFQIQGVAADYLKKVLADMSRSKVFVRHQAVLYAAIYDEICVSINSRNVVPFLIELYDTMTQGIPGLPIPMLCNPAVGVNFADQVEILKDADDELTEDKILSALETALGSSSKEAA